MSRMYLSVSRPLTRICLLLRRHSINEYVAPVSTYVQAECNFNKQNHNQGQECVNSTDQIQKQKFQQEEEEAALCTLRAWRDRRSSVPKALEAVTPSFTKNTHIRNTLTGNQNQRHGVLDVQQKSLDSTKDSADFSASSNSSETCTKPSEEIEVERKGFAVATVCYESRSKPLEEDNNVRKQEIEKPWPEWIALMEVLVQQNFFPRVWTGVDEDRDSERKHHRYIAQGIDVLRDQTSVRQACLAFAKDRFDILRKLSRKDIQILVGHGCPNLDRKVVCSAKRLRAYVQIDEGDVCSTCKLNKSCEAAHELVDEDEPVHTRDIMRILLIYGLDSFLDTVENKLHKRMTVKTSICKLLKEVVALSAIPKPVLNEQDSVAKILQHPESKRLL